MNAYDLNQLLQHYGTKTALANALGIRPQAVYQWEKVPPRRALEIEKITQGLFTAEQENPLIAADRANDPLPTPAQN